MSTGQRRLAMVIGSGGLKCAAAIGVMQVLEAESIGVDMVVGCSGGAVFGAAIALGFSSDRMIETRAQTWTKDVTRKVDLPSLLKIGFPRLYGFDDGIGIFDDSVMAGNIADAFGHDTTFADTDIPFHCVGTDFHTGESVLMNQGNLARAVRISSGVPVVFKPLEWNGRLLIDGGASNPLPARLTTAGDSVQQMTSILINRLLRKQFAFHNMAHHSEIVAILPEFTEGIKINDVDSTPYIVEQGRLETERHVSHLKRVLNPNLSNQQERNRS